MNNYTPAARPSENSQRGNTHPHTVGIHITSAINHSATSVLSPQSSVLSHDPRNIKQTSGWLWQEKQALGIIGQRFTGERLRAARSVYLALTEVASYQFTPDRAHTSCEYLGGLAGLSERATRRYLHEFAALGLVAVELGVHQANTYVLLAVTATTELSAGEMPLADSAGQSRVMASDEEGYNYPMADAPATMVVSGDRPVGIRGDSAGHPKAARGARGGSQQIINRESRISNATTPRAAVRVGAGQFGAEISGVGGDGGIHIPAEKPPLDDQQMASRDALIAIGVDADVATIIAAEYQPPIVAGWTRASSKPTVRDRAAWTLARIRSGEQPPAPQIAGLDTEKYTTGKYAHLFQRGSSVQAAAPVLAIAPAQDERETTSAAEDAHQNTGSASWAQQQPSWGLTAASLQEDTAQSGGEWDTSEQAHTSTADNHAQALWQAVREALRGRVPDNVWSLWLQHVRLIAWGSAMVRLSRPAVGVAATFERRYSSELQAVLAEVRGKPIELEFGYAQLGPPRPAAATCQRW